MIGFPGGAALDQEKGHLQLQVDPDFRPRREFLQGSKEKW